MYHSFHFFRSFNIHETDNPSSNPAAAYSFYVKFVFEKNKNKQEEAGFGPFF